MARNGPNKTVWNFRHGSKNLREIVEERHFQSDLFSAERYAEEKKDAGFGARVYSYNIGPRKAPVRQHYVKVWKK